MDEEPLVLSADIGGTHARFARIGAGGVLADRQTLSVGAHAGLADALAAYRAGLGPPRPTRLAMAVAARAETDEIVFTNSPWHFSCRALAREADLTELVVLNDFTAAALALPSLAPGETVSIGPARPRAGGPIAVIGPGTGLGVSGLVPAGEAFIPLSGEGGHVTLPATTPREWAIVEALAARYGHASAERAISGPGLATLYEILTRLEGVPAAPPLTPEAITERALAGTDLRARQTVDQLLAFLGVVAGNLALTLGASGGVYLAGGILPGLRPLLGPSPFRRRFEARGRFRVYLEAIPTSLVTVADLGLRGAAAALETPCLIGAQRVRGAGAPAT